MHSQLVEVFDFNEAIADAMHILSPETNKRQITLTANANPEPLPV